MSCVEDPFNICSSVIGFGVDEMGADVKILVVDDVVDVDVRNNTGVVVNIGVDVDLSSLVDVKLAGTV